MAAVGGTVSQATGGKFANGAMTGAFIHLFNAENFGQRVMNKVVKGYYSAKGAYKDLTANPIGRIAVSTGTGAVGGGVAGYKYCGAKCIAPGAILGTSGGLVKGAIKEATNYYEIRDEFIFGEK